MKFSHLRLALLMVMALLAFGCNGKRVAVVNTDLAYKDSVLSEKGTEYLRGISEEMQKEFTALQEKAEQAKDKKAAQAEMQAAVMDFQQRLQAEQQQVIFVLSEAYKNAMENVRAKLRIDLLIPSEAAISYDPQLDVTKQVIEEMNAAPVNFKPIAPETPEAPAAENAEKAAN